MSLRACIRSVFGAAAVTAALAGCGDDIYLGAGANFPWPWPIDADFFAEKTVSESVPVAGQVRVRLETVNGEVKATGQPGAGSVMVTATLRVGSDSFADAQNGLSQLDVALTDDPDEVLVRTLQPQATRGRQYRVNYVITFPADLALEVSQVNGRVTIEASEGPVVVDLVNGNVRLSNVVGNVSVQVTNGGIDAAVTLPAGGVIGLSTVNGDIALAIPSSTSADLSARVGIGTITSNNLVFTGRVQTSRSLTGTLGAGAGRIDLETGNGNIDVTGSGP